MALDIQNVFNSLESIVVTYLRSESALTALVSSANIAAKLREDPMNFEQSELPAIRVGAYGYVPTSSPRLNRIQLQIEIVDIKADLETIDSLVKQISALVIDLLRHQSPQLAGNNSKNFNEQVEDVRITGGTILFFNLEDQLSLFWVGGSIQAEIDIYN